MTMYLQTGGGVVLTALKMANMLQHNQALDQITPLKTAKKTVKKISCSL